MSRLILACALIGVGGCESTMGPEPPAPRKPRLSTQPEPKTVELRWADRADRLVIMVGTNPRDVDADGFPDILDVTAMLFEGRGGDPVFVNGRFEFELQPLDETVRRPWRVWEIDEATSSSAAGPTLFNLPGYAFSLDLRDNGGDQMPAIAANLTGRFYPSSGASQVNCVPGKRIVQIGGTSRP